MKILILGDGVIGSVYGNELSRAGYDVTHLIREERAGQVHKDGIKIRCLDCRGSKNENRTYVYRPKVISKLSSDMNYDYFIISAGADKLEKTLKSFQGKIPSNTVVVIFQSLWESMDDINNWLGKDNYILGFPHIVGGGKDENGIYCTIFGNKDAPTMLGEKDGSRTDRLLGLSDILGEIHMNPVVSDNITGWIYTHYAEAAGLLAGVMQSKNYINFAEDKDILKQTLSAVREGLRICKARGIRVNKIKPQCYYFLPSFIMLPFMKKMYSTEAAKLMIRGHVTHSTDEMKNMVFDMIKGGLKYKVETPALLEMKKGVRDFNV
ncbi:MAG: 2-dehydropantoate 2-reductase N-terminal domain-containing protein [Oscillospiraceae bacterium]|nr:2-dehydropantoate 2-reductase N-terminal domain-containing protein [Oscillospiraceae bacterium]